MAASRNKIDPTTMGILNRATCKGWQVILNEPKLDPDIYKGVKEVLNRLGGEWKGGRTQAFVFPFDPSPLLESVRATGDMPPKNPMAFFPTPREVIEEMAKYCEDDLAGVWVNNLRPSEKFRVLEPSAGQGAIADYVREQFEELDRPEVWQIDVVEINDFNASTLRNKGYAVHQMDILDYKLPDGQPPYDLVLMNPPFSLDGDDKAYITHINYVYENLLKPGGILVGVIPVGITFNTDKATSDFRRLVADYGGYEEVPAGAFKESGTSIPTAIINLEKPYCTTSKPHTRREHQGWSSWHAWTLRLQSVSADYETYIKYQSSVDQLCKNLDKGAYGTPVDLFGRPLPQLVNAVKELYNPIFLNTIKAGILIQPDDEDYIDLADHLYTVDYEEYREAQGRGGNYTPPPDNTTVSSPSVGQATKSKSKGTGKKPATPNPQGQRQETGSPLQKSLF